MKKELIEKIFADTAFVHTGGSAEELKVAEYLRDTATGLGLDAHLEELSAIVSAFQFR
jgi:hypothetical protein